MTRSMPRTVLLALPLVALVGGAWGCDTPGPGASPAASAASGSVARVDGESARRLVAQGALLLDVRSAGEFESGHLEGALNIPVHELEARLGEVPRDRPVVTYCLSGGRSRSAAATLAAAGYTVHDLGPISAYPR